MAETFEDPLEEPEQAVDDEDPDDRPRAEADSEEEIGCSVEGGVVRL